MEGEIAIDKPAVTFENLKDLKRTLQKGVHHPPEGVVLRQGPEVYRRDLVRNWLHSKPVIELNEITELENMFVYLKGTLDDEMYRKYIDGRTEHTPREIAYWKLLKEIMVDLNKIKYGEKRTNVNVGFSYENIQEMMMEVHKDDIK